MATITSTSTGGAGQRAMSRIELTGTGDTFTFVRGQILIMQNDTAGSLSPIIDGAGGTSVIRDGVGSIDVSDGYAVGAIAAGAARVIPLNSISSYLKGTIAITGGTGLVCSLLTPG